MIVNNPAYVAEAAVDVDGVDTADLAPLVSGNAPIITAPALEDGDVAEDRVEYKNGMIQRIWQRYCGKS